MLDQLPPCDYIRLFHYCVTLLTLTRLLRGRGQRESALVNRGALCIDSGGRDTHKIPLERNFSMSRSTIFPEFFPWIRRRIQR